MVSELGVARVLVVGEASWVEHVVSDLDGGGVDLEVVPTVDVDQARTQVADERFECVVVADDVATAAGLSLLGATREADSDCATLLVVTDLDAAAERAGDAAGVTELVPAGDGPAWRRTVAALIRQTANRVRSGREHDEALDFYEGLLAGMDDFVVVFGADGEVRYVSPSIEHVTGVAPEAVFDAGPFGLVHPDDVPVIADTFWETIDSPGEAGSKVAIKAQHADGTWRLHEAVASNRLADPRVGGLVVNVRDVTSPPTQRTREYEDLERLTDGFFALDLDRRFTYVNETAAAELGQPVEDLLGQSLYDVLPETVDIDDYERHQAALDAGESVSFELRADTGKYYDVQAYPSETGISVFYRDVTHQHAHERQFRAVFEGAADALVIADDEGRYVDVNPAACDLFGLERDELIGRSIEEFALADYDFDEAWASFTTSTHQRGMFTLVRPDGDRREVEFSASTDVIPDWHLSVLRDVTERRAHERALKERTDRLRSIVENVPIILYAFDRAGRFIFSEGKGLDALGFEPGEVVGESVFDLYSGYPDVVESCRRALDGHESHHTVEVDGIVFDSSYQPVFDDEGRVESVIGVSIDITERTQYEQTLAALHEASRSLLVSETRRDVAEHLVETAVDVLELPALVVYLHDDEENVLRPEATFDDGTAVFGDGPPPVSPDETSILWSVFAADETAVFDDVRNSDLVHSTDNRFRAGLFIPLGEHGVLVAGSPDVGAFDGRTVDLADLLAATGEAALDRVTRDLTLRERDRELKRQNRHLRRLTRVDRLVREIDTALVGAETRTEIERAVCDRLTRTDQFAFAWIATTGEDDALEPRAWTGSHRGYLDAIDLSLDDATEPTVRATREDESVVVDNVATEFRAESWRAEALARGFQSVLSVPLVHDDVTHGVLAIYATEPWSFDETTRAVFGRLARNVASAIDAVERPGTAVSGTAVRYEFAVTDDNCLFNRFARAVDGRVALLGLDLLGEEATAYVSVQGTSPEGFEAVASDQDAVAAVDAIRETADGGIFELHLVGPLLATTFPERGIAIHRLEAEPTGTRIVLDVPGTTDRLTIERSVSAAYPSADLVARTEHARPVGTAPEFAHRLLARLTDRQREVTYAAVLGGYFESPRTITGTDLAAVFDVSSPALHGHLREAQRKLLTELFGLVGEDEAATNVA